MKREIRNDISYVRRNAFWSMFTYYNHTTGGKVSKKAFELLKEIGLTKDNRCLSRSDVDKILTKFIESDKENVVISSTFINGIRIWNVSYKIGENERTVEAACWQSFREYCSHQNVVKSINSFVDLRENVDDRFRVIKESKVMFYDPNKKYSGVVKASESKEN